MILTQTQLQQMVEEISLDSFSRPFVHQATFNRRLKTTGGRYHLNDHHIDFNEQLFFTSDITVITGIIKHELCHYHLHLTNRGYRHRDADFKKLLKKTGGARYAPSTAPKKIECYRCQSCGKVISRQRKINTEKFRCGHCRGKLVWIETNYREKMDR